MSIKNVLVHVDNTESCESRVRTALFFAKYHAANLRGIYARQPFNIPTYAAAQIPKEVLENHEAMAMEEMNKSEQRFRDIADEFHMTVDWRSSQDRLVAAITDAANYSDVVVLGQTLAARYDLLEHQRTDSIALTCGRPVLYVPDGTSFDVLGKRVLIAWDGGRPAVRAIGDAMPILQSADKVCIAMVAAEAKQAETEQSAKSLQDYLRIHEVQSEITVLPDKSFDAGEPLLAQLKKEKSDLLVMGAYGHSRIGELVLGGTTQHVFKHMTTPVLMSH